MVRNKGLLRSLSFILFGVVPLFLLLSSTVFVVSLAQASECPPCPPCRAEQKAVAPSVEAEEQEAPEEIELSKLSDIYGPVDFTHEDHVDLADEGCTQCHHHQTPGAFKPCGACHRRVLFGDPDKLNMPGLSGAYHRQCVGCHVEMGSGPVGCTECHARKKQASAKK